jgi:hypothetical protein
MLWQELVLLKVSSKLCAGAEHSYLVQRFLGKELLQDGIGNLEKPVDLYDVDLCEPLWVVVLHYLYEVSHEHQVLVSSSHPRTVHNHHELSVPHSISKRC